MAPRGRTPRVGNTRMDAAIAALLPMGFSEDLIRKKVKVLLKVYGGPEGWAFIEEASYKVLLDSILEDQEVPEEPKLLEDQAREKTGDYSLEDWQIESRAKDVDGEPSEARPLCLTDRPSCSEQGAGLSSQTVADLFINSILEDQENEKCAPGEPDSLDNQEKKKSGEPSFEDDLQSGTRVEGVNGEASEAGPLSLTVIPSCYEQDAAHLSPMTGFAYHAYVPAGLPSAQSQNSALHNDAPEIDMQDVHRQIAAILETFEHSASPRFDYLPQQQGSAASKPKRRPCLGWIGCKDNDDFVLLEPMKVRGEEERRRAREKPKSRWDEKPDDAL